MIVDLEATCDRGSERVIGREDHEVIEFPFVLYDLEKRTILSEKQVYVKPVNTIITKFCTDLTGITQETVKKEGCNLQDVVDNIEETIREQKRPVVLLTDGKWDTWLLQKEFKEKQIRLKLEPFWRRYFDLKKEFSRCFPTDRFPDVAYHPIPSLKHMQRYLGASNYGLQAHCGLDDCHQICRILEKLLDRGHKLVAENATQLPEGYDSIADPSVKDFNEHFDIPTVTAAQLIEGLSFEPDNVLAIFNDPDHSNRHEGSYIFVLKEYRAQVLFHRGNIHVRAYSKEHFLYECEKNRPSVLSTCWATVGPLLNEALQSQGRCYLNYFNLFQFCKDWIELMGRDIGRAIRQNDNRTIESKKNTAFRELGIALTMCGLPVPPWQLEHYSEQTTYALTLLMQRSRVVIPLQQINLGVMLMNPLSLGLRVEALYEGVSLVTCFNSATEITKRAMRYFRSLVVRHNPLKILAVVDPLSSCAQYGFPKNVRVQEAMDGVSCSLFWDKDWHLIVSKPQYVFPNVVHNHSPQRYPDDLAGAFWRVWREKQYKFPEPVEGRVYCFSLCLPHVGSVVHFTEERLVLEHMFVENNQIFNPTIWDEEATALGWELPQTFPSIIKAQDKLWNSLPILTRGIWIFAGHLRMIMDSPSYEAWSIAIRHGPKASETMEAMFRLAMWLSSSEWILRDYPSLYSLYNTASTWLADKVEQTNIAFKAAGGLKSANGSFHSRIRSSPYKQWLIRMRQDGEEDALSLIRALVPADTLHSMWKFEQRN